MTSSKYMWTGFIGGSILLILMFYVEWVTSSIFPYSMVGLLFWVFGTLFGKGYGIMEEREK